jgi:hypothetical protein
VLLHCRGGAPYNRFIGWKPHGRTTLLTEVNAAPIHKLRTRCPLLMCAPHLQSKRKKNTTLSGAFSKRLLRCVCILERLIPVYGCMQRYCDRLSRRYRYIVIVSSPRDCAHPRRHSGSDYTDASSSWIVSSLCTTVTYTEVFWSTLANVEARLLSHPQKIVHVSTPFGPKQAILRILGGIWK